MTILGKILLFFVLILSLVWTGLTVNAYVTRTNWANDAKKWEAKAKEAAESATYQRSLAEQTRNSVAAQLANLRTELAAAQATVSRLNTESETARQQLARKTESDLVGDPQAKFLQANIAKLQKQVDLLQENVGTMERGMNEAQVAAERAKGEALRATLDRDAALRRADDLESRLISVTDDLQSARTGRTGTSARLAPPDDFRATVKSVTGNLVEISLGANAKLQRGAVLDIWRNAPTSKYLGTLAITSVDPFGAVGQFQPPPGVGRPNPADTPKVGDTVGVLPK